MGTKYSPVQPVDLGVGKDNLNTFARKYNHELTHVYDCINDLDDTATAAENAVDSITEATTTTSGLMTPAMVEKLEGIEDNANNYTYTLPTATSSVLGGVKIGSNIDVSNGVISVSKSDIVSALGYTPQDSSTSSASESITVTASTAGGPGISTSKNSSSSYYASFSTITGISAGTYTISNLLQQLVTKSHTHSSSSKDCDCSDSDGCDGG